MHVDYLLSFYCFYKRLLSWNVMFFFFSLRSSSKELLRFRCCILSTYFLILYIISWLVVVLKNFSKECCLIEWGYITLEYRGIKRMMEKGWQRKEKDRKKDLIKKLR